MIMNFRRSVIIAELWRPEVARLGKNVPFCVFWNKRPLTGKLSKFCPESIHRDTDRRVVFTFREIWPTNLADIHLLQ